VAGNFLLAQDSENLSSEVIANDILTDEVLINEVPTNIIRWYRSNSSGMTLELIPSRLAAMRSEYSLSVRSALQREVPELMLPHFNNGYRIELRTLYHEGIATRYQWVFRDGRGTTRLTAAGRGSHFAVRNPLSLSLETEEEINSGIIEIRNSFGDVTREFQFNEDLSEWDFRYFYRDGLLVRTEIWYKPPPPDPDDSEANGENGPHEAPQPVEPVFALMFTDLYRYTRSGSLRAIDRSFHEGGLEGLRLGFPRLGPGVSFGEELVSHGGIYNTEFFAGTAPSDNLTISYSVDNRGRVLSEIWRDEDGGILGELVNTWVGDRLQSALWRSTGDERLVEFEYDDDGDRIAERNYRNGVLERTVVTQYDQEIEELFMNGRLVLRAVWEDGVKISEERFSPARRSP
jgi:hypothetical protein